MSAGHFDIARENGSLGRKYLRIDLNDVRAANTIIVHYDFDRDGWSIESPTKMAWVDGEDSLDERLEEVAFIPAWSPAAEAELERINGPTSHVAPNVARAAIGVLDEGVRKR